MGRLFVAFLIAVVCAFHAWSGETVYYNPVAGQLVRSPGGQGVDEARIARAAYIGNATLADVLANPDANPFAPEWVENLNAYPLSGRERSVLAAVYEPVMKNTGSVESTFDSVNSQLAWRGLPTHEIASMGNTSTTALVAGSLTGFGATASGKFGFAVNLANGTINNGFLSGSGTTSSANSMDFNLHSGTGTYAAGNNAFTISGFQGTVIVSGLPETPFASITGTAPHGLSRPGDSVSGNFSVGGGFHQIDGSIQGNRVNP